MKPIVVLNGYGLSCRGGGYTRVLTEIIPRLREVSNDVEYVVVGSPEEIESLQLRGDRSFTVSKHIPLAIWDQLVLPAIARYLGAALIYSQRECGPLWGPRTLLHLHEDPIQRWLIEQPVSLRNRMERIYQRIVMPRGFRHAARVIASSKATQESVLKNWSYQIDNVVPLGVADCFLRSQYYPLDSRKYLFHLGSGNPRDNSYNVLLAYCELLKGSRCELKLKVAGSMGSLQPILDKTVSSNDVADRVTMLGYVDDQELAKLFSGARLSILPSSMEGFGLQPLEALASGSPVLCMEQTAVREVVGNHAYFVRSVQKDELAAGIEAALAGSATHGDLGIVASRNWARAFTWLETAKRLAVEVQVSVQVSS